MMKCIPFSPPKITEEDITAVVNVLKSNWITTGMVNEQFATMLTTYTKATYVCLLNSATAGLFLALKSMGIGAGDEVITTPYTFAATANVIVQTGAKLVFVDTAKDSFYIDPNEIYKKINERTKAIIPVDFSTAGNFVLDHTLLAKNFQAHNKFQEALNRPLILVDAAHALGSRHIVPLIDMAVYSFHAVKNITTGEGGALAIGSFGDIDLDREFITLLKLYALHGQDRSAKEKLEHAHWEYDIKLSGYKYNMTDIAAALGLSQLKRYESEILPMRRKLTHYYIELLKDHPRMLLEEKNIFENITQSSCHLFPLRIKDFVEDQRNQLINFCGAHGVSTNVHYKPLTMMSAYHSYENMPNSYQQYQNEITLPLYMGMSMDDIEYVVHIVKRGIQ